LTRLHVKNFRVVDSCCMTHCTPTSNTATRISELRTVTSKDGIHFVETGYKILAASCVSSLRALLSSRNPPDSLHRGRESYYWRGFCIPVGSTSSAPLLGANTVNTSASRYQCGRGACGSGRGRGPLASRPYGYHPYKR
jgi:hypothetical protein